MRSYGPRILGSDSLIFYYDAANIKSYPQSGLSWYDLSGNNHHADLAASQIYNSNNCGSIVFNNYPDYTTIPHSNDFNRTTFSFLFWLKSTKTTLFWDRIISKKINYNDIDGFEIGLYTGTNQNLYIVGATNSPIATIPSVNWLDNKWHNLVVNYDNTIVTVWCDGQYKNQGTITAAGNNTNNLLLGKIAGEDTTLWQGNMSIVQMYNRILTSDEIIQNFRAFKGRFGL